MTVTSKLLLPTAPPAPIGGQDKAVSPKNIPPDYADSRPPFKNYLSQQTNRQQASSTSMTKRRRSAVIKNNTVPKSTNSATEKQKNSAEKTSELLSKPLSQTSALPPALTAKTPALTARTKAENIIAGNKNAVPAKTDSVNQGSNTPQPANKNILKNKFSQTDFLSHTALSERNLNLEKNRASAQISPGQAGKIPIATQIKASETKATGTKATATNATETNATETNATETNATATNATETNATETNATATKATETKATETKATQGPVIAALDLAKGIKSAGKDLSSSPSITPADSRTPSLSKKSTSIIPDKFDPGKESTKFLKKGKEKYFLAGKSPNQALSGNKKPGSPNSPDSPNKERPLTGKYNHSIVSSSSEEKSQIAAISSLQTIADTKKINRSDSESNKNVLKKLGREQHKSAKPQQSSVTALQQSVAAAAIPTSPGTNTKINRNAITDSATDSIKTSVKGSMKISGIVSGKISGIVSGKISGIVSGKISGIVSGIVSGKDSGQTSLADPAEELSSLLNKKNPGLITKDKATKNKKTAFSLKDKKGVSVNTKNFTEAQQNTPSVTSKHSPVSSPLTLSLTTGQIGQNADDKNSRSAPLPTGLFALQDISSSSGSIKNLIPPSQPSPNSSSTNLANVSPQMVTKQINLAISRQAVNGIKTFRISLKPADLGQVDIKMDIQKDGKVIATITVDNQRTLNLLHRDQGTLQKALANSGFDAGGNSLNFTLRQQQQNTPGYNYNAHNNDPTDTDDDVIPSLSDNIIHQQHIKMIYSDNILDINI